MGPASEDARSRASEYLEAERFSKSRQVALEGLNADPDNVELLILAGRAGVEVDAPDAAELLRRATELAPDNAGAWRHLGEAFAADGRTEEADAAFRRVVEIDPEDPVALTHLGHTSVAAGRSEEGVGYLARAADIAPTASTATISLVEMYRSFGDFEKALAQARQLADAAPNDLHNWLDIAELSLLLGQFDDAGEAFGRLRDLDDVPGHEAYPLHGMLQVELLRSNWDAAEELAAQAAAIDEHGLSTDIAAFLAVQRSGPGEAPAPTAEEVQAGLRDSLAVYRRAVSEDRQLGRGFGD